MIVSEIKNYPVSRDYAKLWELAQKQSVVCVVDYIGCRDVAQTLFKLCRGEWSGDVCVRGHSYVYGFDKEVFIKQCEGKNLEWIVPNEPAGAVMGDEKGGV